MEWRQEFSVGIPELDGQHQTLEGFIGLVETAVTTKQRWSTVHSALVQLTDFVRIHFSVEESLMRIHGYPEMARHVDEHLKFTDQLRQLQEKSLRVDVSDEMVAFLRKWQDAHIALNDNHCAAHFPTAGIVTGVRTAGKDTDPVPASSAGNTGIEAGRKLATEAQEREAEMQVQNRGATVGDWNDWKLDRTIKAHIDGLMHSMKCSKNFACAQSNSETLCRAKDIGLKSNLVCLEEVGAECDYRLKSDFGQFCQCPIRICLAKTQRRLPAGSSPAQ